jgi:predicted alpha/beta-fold hydrolase
MTHLIHFKRQDSMNNNDQEQVNPSRRSAMVGSAVAAAAAVATALPLAAVSTDSQAAAGKVAKTASTITTRDGVEIYYKDWGPKTGQPVVLSHGWPLNADSWESAAFHLANNGFRVVTHDRRGHGRSSQPWDGNDMDHYADDLAQLIEALDLKNIILAGFSTGGGEVARYVGRHGTKQRQPGAGHRRLGHALHRHARLRPVHRRRLRPGRHHHLGRAEHRRFLRRAVADRARAPGRLGPAGGGVLVGAGIGVMHYAGMAGMRMGLDLRYDPRCSACRSWSRWCWPRWRCGCASACRSLRTA